MAKCVFRVANSSRKRPQGSQTHPFMFSQSKIEAELFQGWQWAHLLYQACQPHESASLAWREWRHKNGLQGRCQAFLPQIWHNLGSQVCPDESSFRSVTHKVWQVNADLLRGGELALSQLNQAGIPAMVLKGACMQIGFGVPSHLRSMGDFDLLVPFELASQALDCLGVQGWIPVLPSSRAKQLAHHGSTFIHQSDPALKLDLHWHSLKECRWQGADRALWSRSQEFQWRSLEVRLPAPSDALLITICHAAGPGDWGKPWVLDVQAIVESAGPEIWEQALEEARARRIQLPFRAGCRFLVQETRWKLPWDCLMARSTLLERAYFWALLRTGSLPAATVHLLTDYLRTTSAGESFLTFLKRRWGVGSLSQLWREFALRYNNRLHGGD